MRLNSTSPSAYDFRYQLLTSFILTIQIEVYQHKMNFLAFTVLVLIAVSQTAWALRCHQCQPDYTKVMADVQNFNNSGNHSGGMSICNKPTETFDCSQDPQIGNMADSCFTASITLNTSLGIGDIHVNVLNCSIKAMCSTLKKMTCDLLASSFGDIPMIGVKSCDVTCCEGDLCNDPSGSASSTTTDPNAPTTGTTAKSSTKITSIPPNAALFSILGLFTLMMSFMNLF